MSVYVVSDIEGCYHTFIKLLDRIHFNPECDQLIIAGDLVNRGNGSLKILQYCYQHQSAISCVLGNHDLFLVAAYYAKQHNYPLQSSIYQRLKSFFDYDHADTLIQWLMSQSFMQSIQTQQKTYHILHAGLYPNWSIKEAISYAHQCFNFLKQNLSDQSFIKIFCEEINSEKKDLHFNLNSNPFDQIRFITNAFTKMRFLNPDQSIHFKFKDDISKTNDLTPWFTNHSNLYESLAENDYVLFGHWGSLINKQVNDKTTCLDYGCAFGNRLCAYELGSDKQYFEDTVKKDLL